MSSMLWLAVSSALAKGPPVRPGSEPEPEPLPPALEIVREQGVTLSFKVLGEIWEAPEIVQVYRGNAFMIGAGVQLPVHRYLLLDAEIAYERVSGTEVLRDGSGGAADTSSAFELIPLSLLVEGRLPVGSSGASVFAGAGPSLAVWKEEFSPVESDTGVLGAGSTNLSGAKLGGEARGGLRFDIDMRPTRPGEGHVDGFGVELAFGRRFQQQPELDGGLDLAAWRGSIGLGVRFK